MKSISTRFMTTILVLLVGWSFMMPIPSKASPVSENVRASPDTFRNPIKENGPDPWIQYHEGFYYLTVTRGDRITVTRASSVSSLGETPESIVWQDSTPSRCCNIWAPELHRFGDRWYIYYSATGTDPSLARGRIAVSQSGTHRMYVLESVGLDPLGPYAFKGKLDTTIDSFAIDGTVFEQPGGELYLVWSGAPNLRSGAQNLYIAPMSNPWTVSGERVLLSRPKYEWELRPRPGAPRAHKVNEGPAVLQHDGRVFLTYSASGCDLPDYALGMLSLEPGADPLDARAWIKSQEPVFSRSDLNWVFGPGHNGFFTSPDGTETWIVYHAVSQSQGSPIGACDATRSTRIQKVHFNVDGSPDFGVPLPSWQSQALPAGDPGGTVVPDGRYKISTGINGNALGAGGCSTDTRGEVAVSSYRDGPCQKWDISYDGAGSYRLTSANSHRSLNVKGCSTDNGADVDVQPHVDGGCQKWYLDSLGDDKYRIRSRVSGKSLNVEQCSGDDGTDVTIWPYWGDRDGCQVWLLERIG
ncbi:MAG TPA: family 43 glycosylhydrolase [Pseudonocardiaceae bacterium]|nr:family 43 glycosylhydrolase [Pseudonocardiaceae bacterium]